MKPNEYNPNHTHNGQLTWVIYLETPNEEERKERLSLMSRSSIPKKVFVFIMENQLFQRKHIVMYQKRRNDFSVNVKTRSNT